MSDGMNEKIGEEGFVPLLVIAEDDPAPEPAPLAPEAATPAVEVIAPVVGEAASKPHAAVPGIDDLLSELDQLASLEPEPAKPEPKPAPAPAAAISPGPATSPESQLSPSAPSASFPQPQAEKQALAEPPVAARPKRGLRPFIPLAAVSLAVFASSISVIGLLVASRTVAETRIVLEKVQANQNKREHLDTLIAKIDKVRQREQLALARLERISASKPATLADVQRTVGGLQLAIAKFQPGGTNGSIALLRDGQGELAERVNTMYRRVEQMNDKMDKLLVSSNPRAKRAGDREPIS